MTILVSRSVSLARLAAVSALAAAALSGCYVVPMQAPPPGPLGGPAQAVPGLPVAPNSQTFPARLYPSNAEAARYGMVNGVVTSDLNGRGHLSAVIGGEEFRGDATRAQGSRSGVANAAGARGGMLNCRYTMNSSTLGSGECALNGGATFTMHIGS